MRNPHSILQINVLDNDGNAQRDALEFPKGLSTLGKQGVNADTLKVGDEITVTMNPPLTPRSGIGNLKTLKRKSDGFEWSDGRLRCDGRHRSPRSGRRRSHRSDRTNGRDGCNRTDRTLGCDRCRRLWRLGRRHGRAGKRARHGAGRSAGGRRHSACTREEHAKTLHY